MLENRSRTNWECLVCCFCDSLLGTKSLIHTINAPYVTHKRPLNTAELWNSFPDLDSSLDGHQKPKLSAALFNPLGFTASRSDRNGGWWGWVWSWLVGSALFDMWKQRRGLRGLWGRRLVVEAAPGWGLVWLTWEPSRVSSYRWSSTASLKTQLSGASRPNIISILIIQSKCANKCSVAFGINVKKWCFVLECGKLICFT